MKLSDYRGEKALEVLADIIEPAVEIMQDKRISTAAKAGKTMDIVKIACKYHKQALITIMAVLDGEYPATYEVGVLTLPAKILEIVNDPDIQTLFTSPPKREVKKSSGKKSDNIVALEKQEPSSDMQE